MPQHPHDLSPNEGISMRRFRVIPHDPAASAHCADASRVLPSAVAIGLALVMLATFAFGLAVRSGNASMLDQQLVLDPQHRLVIHSGPFPTCVSIPNPPQHDCFSPRSERRTFSVAYVTPHGAWSLLSFQLPEP